MNGTSEEDTSKRNRRKIGCNPFKLRREDADGKCDIPLVGFEPQLPTASKTRSSFGYGEETSEVAMPISPHALRLFEAIREDEMDLVEAELASLTNKHQIDKLGTQGFALIHVAARYNFSRIVGSLLDHRADVNIGTLDYNWTPLHLAARFNCLSTVVDVLLPRGADPTRRDKNGSMPLHLAARRGNEEIVKILLDRPDVLVDAKDSSGKTALHLASSEGHKNVCQILLNHGANIKAIAADKMTPLHSAIHNSHSEVARLILNRAADRDVDTNEREMLMEEDLQSNTVLHLAAWNNDVKTAELCLDHGANVNVPKCSSGTALHLAALKGNLEMAELLIERGADVNSKDGDAKTPLHKAALFNQTKVIDFLVEKEAKLDARDIEGRSPFLNAVAAGHIESALLLHTRGADIHATDLLTKNCVHIAVENEHLNVLGMLLDKRSGAHNLNKGDIFGRVPLHYAATTENIKILELVLSKQERHSMSFQDEHHKTPLHLAAERSSSKHVEALAKHLSKLNARDDKGRTPLHSAARKGQRKSCLTLLNLGAEVDSRDNKHRTPLMWATKNNQLKCVEILLDFRASPDLQDAGGDTALHVASTQGHGAVVTLLLDRGASLTLHNNQECACLETAAKAGSSDAAMAISKHKRWVELENYQTSKGQSAISLLIENFPDAAEVVFNKCVNHCEHLSPSDPGYTVSYDFKYLDHDPHVKSPKGRFSAVQAMIKHRRERLLLHPLTLKFNELKWTTLGRAVFMVDFITYLLLMIFFTIFIVNQRSGQNFKPGNGTRPFRPQKSRPNTLDDSEQKPSDIYKRDSVFVEVVAPLILVFAVIHIMKEFLQIYMQRWTYFKDFSNYLDWTLYITSFLFMVPFVTTPKLLDEWFSSMKDPRSLWIVGILAIFVCYTNMMLFLRRYRLFGTYISMYVEVTKTVFQVMAVFIFLLLGFALVFYIFFKEQIGFHTVEHSLLRVLVMMIGELDFGATFIDTIGVKNERNQNPLNPFPPFAFIFLFLCLVLLTIALMNLLVGLAVGDTETMKKYATIKRLEMQLQYQIDLEEAYPTFLTRRAYLGVYVEKPNVLKLSRFHRILEWLQARFAEISPVAVEDGESSEQSELKIEMMKNKKRIKSIMEMLESQNKLLRRLAVKIDPKFQFSDGAEGDLGVSSVDGDPQESRAPGETIGERPTDSIGGTATKGP